MADTKRYVEVRALERGIALLTELNKLGHARAPELAAAAKIDRTTTYRLLETLKRLGLVDQRDSDRAFLLTADVRRLSEGYQDRDRLTQSASLHLGSLFPKVLWPTDFATFEQGAMIIRETTHRFSPYSVHRAMIGRKRPLFTSALGRAFLCGAAEAQRATVIDIARGAYANGAEVPGAMVNDSSIESLLNDYAMRGYASSIGETEPHISAIARPIVGPDGAYGAVNIVFFSSAMSPAAAADRFLEPLRDCVDRIQADICQ